MYFGFKKEERLKNASDIDTLFRNGRNIASHPLKLIYILTEGGDSNKTRVLITVSSKRFRNAVDRNRIKRKIKEIYRLNKHLIAVDQMNDASLMLGIVYTGEDSKPDQATLKSAFIKCIDKLNRHLQ